MKNNPIISTIELYNMESNGYAYFNDNNFNQKNNLPCYIPENAEEDDDIFSYKDLLNEVENWIQTEQAKVYIKENENDDVSIESWVQRLYENLEWEFPSTLLSAYLYNF